jgi:membrane protease YdiL (CAAX protease family)
MAVFLALSLFSPEFIPLLFTTNDRMTLLLTSVGAGLVVGSFEEIGWTGFAVPRLRQRYALLVTGIVMGMVWGAWHSLVFWESDTFAGVLPLALLLVRLFAWLPAYRVLMTWVYNHTESLFVAILMHGSLVASQFIFSPRTLAGTTALVSLLVWAAVLWGTVAVIMLTSRGHLSQQPLREQAV